jgi:hypothetical protein
MTKRTAVTILVALATMAATAAPAPAYNLFTQSSLGQINGNGPYGAYGVHASADGSRVFFETTEKLTVGDTDTKRDVYARTGTHTVLVTPGTSSEPLFRSASSNGERAFFVTWDKLASSDTDGQPDLYEYYAGSVRHVSVGAINGNDAYQPIFEGASADGSHVFFLTEEKLTSDDKDSRYDVYDRTGGVTKLVSRGAINGNGDEGAYFTGASSDGSHVFFETVEGLVAADTDGVLDVYERAGGETKRVSAGAINSNGSSWARYRGSTPDGSHVYFATQEPLVATDTDESSDVYERSAGTTTLVSRGEVNGNGEVPVEFRTASADGTRVFFDTEEALASDDTDTSLDIYERSGGTTKRVSKGQVNGNGAFKATFRGISADGAHVFFETLEALGSNDLDAVNDVYDRSAGQTTRISKGAVNGNGASPAQFARASADGTRVFFLTSEQLTGDDTDVSTDVYAWSAGALQRISRGGRPGNGDFNAWYAGAAADGSRVYFGTKEQLSCNDDDAESDVYGASSALDPKPEACSPGGPVS